jgi:hypothetical protein
MLTLLSEIELFMDTHRLSHWQFGQAALGDKHFVRQLRDGRDIRVSTERRVRDFMLTYRSEQEAA